MSQIKQLLRLHKQGKGKREIGRIPNISKNTVKASFLSIKPYFTFETNAVLNNFHTVKIKLIC